MIDMIIDGRDPYYEVWEQRYDLKAVYIWLGNSYLALEVMFSCFRWSTLDINNGQYHLIHPSCTFEEVFSDLLGCEVPGHSDALHNEYV